MAKALCAAHQSVIEGRSTSLIYAALVRNGQLQDLLELPPGHSQADHGAGCIRQHPEALDAEVGGTPVGSIGAQPGGVQHRAASVKLPVRAQACGQVQTPSFMGEPRRPRRLCELPHPARSPRAREGVQDNGAGCGYSGLSLWPCLRAQCSCRSL